eukprot:TRINITY_DN66941_c0_g1_i1.p1 TRINITY_DN66941_c0_g1~~TRINITY_DN66941_c0_g1_i1.p1  ORF type:complete len:161 (+),score=94.78 TRINITY_DN66941_c0_g1_i1:61-543(+)
MANLTDKQLKDTFDLFDADGSGAIDVSELGLVMEGLGFGKLPAVELDELVRQLDRDGSQLVEFDEFRRACRAKAAYRNSKEEVELAFKLFVHNDGGEGVVNVDDFCLVAEHLGEEVKPELYREIIREAAGPSAEGLDLDHWFMIHREVTTDKHRPNILEY